MLDWQLYRDSFSTREMRAIWSETATISTWIGVEKTLAQCQADVGLIPREAAERIALINETDLDHAKLAEDMLLVGRPIVGLLKQLRTQIGDEFASYLHYKTTTQDIMDTTQSLQMKSGASIVIDAIQRLTRLLDDLSRKHETTMMVARTNAQHALPITLSIKLDVWRAELERRETTFKQSCEKGLNVQLAGPVGDLHGTYGSVGQELKASVAKQLGLDTINPHWQNARDGVADIIGALGTLCATLCKIAHNINLLSSSDIAEVSECHSDGKGSSSSMAHKKNQRSSEFCEAIARLGRQRAEQINETTLHQHERSGGAWIAEWAIVPDVFQLTSGALMWAERIFSELEIHTDNMKDRLDAYNNGIGLQNPL